MNFLLVRNPAIKIIGKRNEREGEEGISPNDAPGSPYRAEMGSRQPENQDSDVQTVQPVQPPFAPPNTVEPAESAVAKAEPSQPVPSKEEASSRLEALLHNTVTLSPKNTHFTYSNTLENNLSYSDLNKEHHGGQPELCHIVKFEASSRQDVRQSSRLPRPVRPIEVKKEENCNKNSQNKRYRSSIRIMVRPEAVQSLQKPIRANSSDGLSSRSTSSGSESARSAKKLSAAGVRGPLQPQIAQEIQAQMQTQPQRPIVKEQFR